MCKGWRPLQDTRSLGSRRRAAGGVSATVSAGEREAAPAPARPIPAARPPYAALTLERRRRRIEELSRSSRQRLLQSRDRMFSKFTSILQHAVEAVRPPAGPATPRRGCDPGLARGGGSDLARRPFPAAPPAAAGGAPQGAHPLPARPCRGRERRRPSCPGGPRREHGKGTNRPSAALGSRGCRERRERTQPGRPQHKLRLSPQGTAGPEGSLGPALTRPLLGCFSETNNKGEKSGNSPGFPSRCDHQTIVAVPGASAGCCQFQSDAFHPWFIS